MEKEKIYCPVNGWDCPYWRKDGSCVCENVETECDDYASFWGFWEDEVDESNYDPYSGCDVFETVDCFEG